MGWSYRKSVSLGPFRVNLSKSGIGYSVARRTFAWVLTHGAVATSRSPFPGPG